MTFVGIQRERNSFGKWNEELQEQANYNNICTMKSLILAQDER